MKKLLILLALCLTPTLAFAQSQRNPCYVNINGGCNPVGISGAPNGAAPLPVTVSGSTGSSDINITGINGTAPSATNPLYVSPATSANPWPVVSIPTSVAANGIVPVVSTALEACHVLKGTPGNLYSAYAANSTATAGFLIILNATTAPADGAVTPLDVATLPANGTALINYNSGPPSVYSTGITACVTSAATPFTKTTGVITAFIKGSIK